MVLLKETIAASFQMLERLAGSQNFIYSLVYGCDDSGDSDRFLNYEDELIDADCSNLTTDYDDSPFQFLNEAFQSTDYPTRNVSFDKSLRDHYHEPEIRENEIECEANVSSSDSSCTKTRNKRPHSRSCSCSRVRFVSDSKNSSTSQVSWREDHDAQLLECEDACSEPAQGPMQHHVAGKTSAYSRVEINSSYSECCGSFIRNIEDCQLRVSKLNDIRAERGTKIIKRNTPEMFGNSSQVNSSSKSKLNESSAQSGSSPEAFSYEDSTGGAGHDLLNPECSVCFRKHAERDDDVTFSCYGVLPDCQHSFCQCCIASWLQQSAVDRWRCPVCRTSVLFTFVSRLWLPHNTDEKTRQLAGTRTRLLLIRMVLKKTTRLLRVLLFYWTIGVKALRNLIEEITPEFEPLLHRHEIGAFI